MSASLQNSRNRNRNRQAVSGRGGYPSHKRESSEPEPTESSPLKGLYADHCTALVMCSFMGTQTLVKTKNGSTYKGHTIGFSDKGDIAMVDARLEDGDNSMNPNLSGLIIPKDKFVVCKTNGVDLKGLCTSSADFTDSGIVSRMNGSSETPMRELQPWHDDDAPDVNSTLSLDDGNEGWDSHSMFQANRDKFNVQSTYCEDLHEYTTKLPDPDSEGYEERQKFAQKHAEEIEQSEDYHKRIAKELTDGDEENLYSAVHRSGEPSIPHRLHDSNTGSGKNTYTIPALRKDSDQGMNNGSVKGGQGRGARHNSYSPSPGHVQQPHYPHHQSLQQNARQINNHYQGPPPSSGGPLGRNQGPGPLHARQQGQQNHAGPSHSHPHHPSQQYQQTPPPSHPGIHQNQPPAAQHQRPSHHQQVSSSPISQHSGKPHPAHSHPQNVPSTLSQQPPPPQGQHPSLQKVSPPHTQSPVQQPPPIKGASINGPSGPLPSGHPFRQSSIEGKNSGDYISQKGPPIDINQQIYNQKSAPMHSVVPTSMGGQRVPEAHLSASSSSSSLAEAQQMGHPNSVLATSPPTALLQERRVGQGVDPTPEERNKIDQSLHDFQRNFVLESNGVNSQESPRHIETADSTPVSSTPASSSIASTPVSSSAPELIGQLTEQAGDISLKGADKPEEEDTPHVPKFKLNPNAKEFKPKSQTIPMEPQSPSPQPRSSPHMPQMVHYSPQTIQMLPCQYIMTNQLNPQRKRATVSLGAGVVSDLAAHQVTGQPLLATQPAGVMYIQTPGQPLQTVPAGYQIYSPQIINPRMIAPGSLTMAQTGQVTGLEQAAAQNQPQPVFMTAPQSVPGPIPAHLHPQPAHAQAMPHPSSSQQVQPTHVPNPAPSPVQHQQYNSQPIPQSLPHHMSQGQPQSATPQPAHYPQMTINYSHGIPTIPRTSISGQQNMTTGHSSMSFMSTPQFAYNGSTAQYAFPPAPQPQTPQSSSHGSGPQTHQYVVMPQPSPQGHPSIPQHTPQPYTATGIPYQSQHLMQGPPQMPPSHTPNPNQGSPHLIHAGVPAGIHQQVSAAQPGMYVQALQYHQQ